MKRVDRYTCEETFRRLDDYLDRELTPAERALVQAHLECCAVCAGEFVFESAVLRGVRTKLLRLAVPPGLVERVTRALNGPRPSRPGDGGGT